MEVFENDAFALEEPDLGFLKARLGGWLEQRGSLWAITRVVGHVQLPSGRALRIRSPKAPGAALLGWMAYVDPTLAGLGKLGSVHHGADSGDLSALLVSLLLAELQQVLARYGLNRGYERVERETAVVRGSIDFARLLTRGGDLARTPCVLWERRSSTRVNRLICAALQRAWRDPVMRAAGGGMLRQFLGLYADLDAQVDRDLLAGRSELTRVETAFAAVVALSRLLLRNSFLGAGSAQTGAAFLVNLEALFEKTVVKALRDAGIDARAKVPVPYQCRAIGDTEWNDAAMEMDVWCPGLGDQGTVVDAKYRSKVSPAMLQQMVTYCLVMGTKRGVLVFPEGVLGGTNVFRFAGGVEIRALEMGVAHGTADSWKRLAKQLGATLLRLEASH
jgi:5-methylcytosine-specific restriction endonuclease McrBC regulatory subunit McrC